MEGLFKIDGVNGPYRLHGEPEIWAVSVTGQHESGQFAAVPMEFSERVHADAVMFGVSKLMDKTDLWFGPVPGQPMKELTEAEIAEIAELGG
ncbi:hypothetical protein LCGC14_0911870 [marine sediment metagenome]|uniref:Uncharacterized protein n=1 Tax=marine sediment metagenome TaxID=412755 RepID=A0A0F9RCA5_9ZZZZ